MRVRLRRRDRHRCGICRRRAPGYDAGDGRRRWRAPDLGLARAYLEADAPRVRCPEHGVVAAAVPWARHGAGHTRMFEAVDADATAMVCRQTLAMLPEPEDRRDSESTLTAASRTKPVIMSCHWIGRPSR